MAVQFDSIGYWTEIKLDIIRDYASAYSRILSAQTRPRLHHVYIDAFAGAGTHQSRTTGAFVPGSPKIALDVVPPFKEYYFIDIDKAKVAELNNIAQHRPEVHVHEGDCNSILVTEVFPKVRYEEYKRGLCLLDPYGLHLDWNVVFTAGQMKSIDMFINFPVADINRNVLWHLAEGVDPADIARMDSFWGDESWKSAAYSTQHNLFGLEMKESNEAVVSAFQQRLHDVAGFAHVSRPLPMRNSRHAIIYYLLLASQKETAGNVIRDIFAKYRSRGSP